jgi:hypothetical protein
MIIIEYQYTSLGEPGGWGRERHQLGLAIPLRSIASRLCGASAIDASRVYERAK